MARPNLPEEQVMKKRCEILFTEKEWQWLVHSAKIEGFSVPQFIRLLCRRWYIENHIEANRKDAGKGQLPTLI